MEWIKCTCKSPHCKECKNEDIVKNGVRRIIELNETSVDLLKKATNKY